MAKKKPTKKAPIAPKKQKRNIVRRTNKKGKAYFYNRRQGKIVTRDSFKKESKRIAKRKEKEKLLAVKKVKKRIPKKGTPQYTKWRKRYAHLRKCSKVRSIAYENYPEIFPTYASTAAFCKFFLKRKERATFKNIDAAIKEFQQTIARPDIPEKFFESWFWFETDFRMDELRSYVVTSLIPNLWVRSPLSSMPTFLINEYTYDSTFKAYVDWKNAQQEGNRDEGRDYTELLVTLNFNYKKARWEIFIQEEENPGGEPYAPTIPYDTLIKEEGAEPQGPIIARGGEEKVGKKKGKAKGKVEKIEKKPLTKNQRNKIRNEISTLEGIRTYIIEDNKLLTKEVLKYKKAGNKDFYTESVNRLKIRRKEIDSINKKIIRLKTIEKRGYL